MHLINGIDLGDKGKGKAESNDSEVPLRDQTESEPSDEEPDEEFLRIQAEAQKEAAISSPVTASPIQRMDGSFQPLPALLEEKDESAAGTSLAGTYTEKFDRLLRETSHPGSSSTESQRRRQIYDRVDKSRRIDPGVDLDAGKEDSETSDGSEGSGTPSMSPYAQTPDLGEGTRRARKILNRIQEDDTASVAGGWRSIR